MLKGMRDELFKLASEEGGLKIAADRMMRALRRGEIIPDDVADTYTLHENRPRLEQELGRLGLQLPDFRAAMQNPEPGPIVALSRDESKGLVKDIEGLLSTPPPTPEQIRRARERVAEILEEDKKYPPIIPHNPKKLRADLLEGWEGDLPWGNRPVGTRRYIKTMLDTAERDPIAAKIRAKAFGREKQKELMAHILREMPPERRAEFMRARNRRLAEKLEQAMTTPTQNLLPAASSPLSNLNEETISRILHPAAPLPNPPAIPAMGDVATTSPPVPPSIDVGLPAAQAAESIATERPVIQAMENAATESPTIKAIQHVGQVANAAGKKPMNPWLKRGLIGAGLTTAGLGAYGLYRALSKDDEQDEEGQQEAQPTVAPPPVTPGV